jgi:hypothetical protein
MKYIDKLNRAALRIKVKNLAYEAQIIRKEEVKWKGAEKVFFKHHRKTTVRHEARATHLAVAFMVGVPYEVLEQTCRNLYTRKLLIPHIEAMVRKYATVELKRRIRETDSVKFRKKKGMDVELDNLYHLNKHIDAWFNGEDYI